MPIGLLLPENDRSLGLSVRTGSAHIETLTIHGIKSIWDKNVLLADNFTELQHIGLPVSDLDRSVGFYKKLGFKKLMGKEFEEVKRAVPVPLQDQP